MDILKIRQQMKENKTKLIDALNKTQDNYKDTRFWTLDYDKNTKVGKAIIRPIGPADGESDEYVTEYTHFIRRNNRILSLVCPTTSKQKCPICNHYFSEDKENRDKQFSRLTKHIMNIYIVKDYKHPENEGKVFLWRCPVTIMNKINEALKETDNMDRPKESINVFDMWEGADIDLITCDKGGFINYENSVVEPKSPIFEDTENTLAYEQLYKQLYKLNEFKETMTFDEVKEKFDNFMELVDTNKTSNIIKKEARLEQKELFDSVEDKIDDEIPEKFDQGSEFSKMSTDDIFDEL